MDPLVSRWRLILGGKSDPQQSVNLNGEAQQMDKVLEQLYDSDRKGGLGGSSPNINRWLGDIRKYFSTSIVQVMQQDALERLGLEQMLLEPELLESVQPDVSLVASLLSLNKVMPEKTKATAKKVVRTVVKDLEKRLKNPLIQAITGSLNRGVKNRNPRLNEIDWNATIRKNLKHYQPSYKTIIPEHLVGHGRKGQSLKQVILCIDQSGSMASSVVYASIFGAVMASIRSVKTQMVVFDTAVVDLTADLKDPVDLLFGTQLGGGTDINKALSYVQGLIRVPSDTILILITDLFEGGNQNQMLKRVASIKASGVQLITLLALSDEGAPIYDKQIAGKFGALGVPSFACSPDLFPDLMAAAIKKTDMNMWVGRNQLKG